MSSAYSNRVSYIDLAALDPVLEEYALPAGSTLMGAVSSSATDYRPAFLLKEIAEANNTQSQSSSELLSSLSKQGAFGKAFLNSASCGVQLEQMLRNLVAPQNRLTLREVSADSKAQPVSPLLSPPPAFVDAALTCEVVETAFNCRGKISRVAAAVAFSRDNLLCFSSVSGERRLPLPEGGRFSVYVDASFGSHIYQV